MIAIFGVPVVRDCDWNEAMLRLMHASDPFLSDAVALRACLLAANETPGLPGPQPSPERDIAKAVLAEWEANRG